MIFHWPQTCLGITEKGKTPGNEAATSTTKTTTATPIATKLPILLPPLICKYHAGT